jgi:TP901 family phage tail tape measure protein
METSEFSEVVELVMKLRNQLSAPLARASGDMGKFEAQLQKTERTARSLKSMAIAGAVFGGMGYAIEESLKSTIEPAMQFEQAQQALQIASGATAQQLKAFADQSLRLSDTLPVNREEIVKTQATLAKMLGSTSAAMQNTEEVSKFAIASQMSASSAAELLGSAYQTLGNRTLPVQQGMAQIADLMTTLQTKYSVGTRDGEMLSRSFAHLALAARTYGVSAQQAAAMLGLLNRAGLGGGRGAGVYGEELLLSLGKLGKSGIPEITKYGIALAHTQRGGLDLIGTLLNMHRAGQAQVAAYLKSLGSEGVALTYLYQHTQALIDATRDFANVSGATLLAEAKMASTPEAKMRIFAQTIQNLKETIGEALIPVLISVTDAIRPAVQWFTKFAELHPRLIQISGVIAAIVGGLALVAGPALMIIALAKELGSWLAVGFDLVRVLADGIRALDMAALANPIGLAIAGATLLAFGGYEVWKNWDKVKTVFADVWNWIKRTYDLVAGGLSTEFHKIAADVERIGSAIAHPFRHATPAVTAGVMMAATTPLLASPSASMSIGASASSALMSYQPIVNIGSIGSGATSDDIAEAVARGLQDHARMVWDLMEQRDQYASRTLFDR